MITNETNNQVTFLSTTPNLAIHGSASPVVKTAATFLYRANGAGSPATTTADTPSLALATRMVPNAPLVTPLDFDNGTVPAATNSCICFTLVGTLANTQSDVNGVETSTLSWIAGEKFPKHRAVQASDFPMPSGSNQCPIGYVYVKNETAAQFVPGTTALDTASLTVVYSDNYAKAGN